MICFCNDASALCCSDFTAPSVLPRIVATSPFEKREDELQRQHLLLLVREVLDQLEEALPPDRVKCLDLRGVLLVPDGLRDFLLGLHAARRAEVVHREVVRDPKEPG